MARERFKSISILSRTSSRSSLTMAEPRRFFTCAAEVPASAFYSTDLGEFILPYDEVRTAQSPEEVLLDFMQTTYEAAAELAKWDRASLEGVRYL
jgi:hypothetical protein